MSILDSLITSTFWKIFGKIRIYACRKSLNTYKDGLLSTPKIKINGLCLSSLWMERVNWVIECADTCKEKQLTMSISKFCTLYKVRLFAHDPDHGCVRNLAKKIYLSDINRNFIWHSFISFNFCDKWRRSMCALNLVLHSGTINAYNVLNECFIIQLICQRGKNGSDQKNVIQDFLSE